MWPITKPISTRPVTAMTIFLPITVRHRAFTGLLANLPRVVASPPNATAVKCFVFCTTNLLLCF